MPLPIAPQRRSSESQPQNEPAQYTFQDDLIRAYDARMPGGPATRNNYWCPILQRYTSLVVTAHLFSAVHGQADMDAIFGPMERSELFAPENGIIISGFVEQAFDCGLMAIVPDISNDAPLECINAWVKNAPKEYKIRIISQSHPFARLYVADLARTWGSLDGQRLNFKATFRPRAQYLFFHYCVQLLRWTWSESFPSRRVRDENLDKPVWTILSRHVKKGMLQAFADEIGRDYHHLVEGTQPVPQERMSRKQVSDDSLLVLVAARQIEENSETSEDDYAEYSEEGEEEEYSEHEDEGEYSENEEEPYLYPNLFE